ncbi:MAG: CRISPR-associated DxTHG motif protein, partial [Geminicoccaceae bacterium]|nr:CRISPR-associated DxTHG motif protein [Geminicoccaceae bacterium]
GRYEPVRYGFEGREAASTPYVARALAELFAPGRILVLATEEARAKHEDGLRAALAEAGTAVPEFVAVPSGGARADQLALFAALKAALRGAEGPVILDITHGFRAQPFLAAAVVAFVRAVDDPPPETRVVYAAFEAKSKDGVAPIWDLTYLVELLDWTFALRMFLQTGRAEEAADATGAVGRALAKARFEGGKQGPRPELNRLAKALHEFGADLETLRTG